jgi:predicted  nucleic acid-binding Zn-ribbon protein
MAQNLPYKEKLKLAEKTSVEMEQSESQLRERTAKAEDKGNNARRQTQEYLSKIEELKEIILDKDIAETSTIINTIIYNVLTFEYSPPPIYHAIIFL